MNKKTSSILKYNLDSRAATLHASWELKGKKKETLVPCILSEMSVIALL